MIYDSKVFFLVDKTKNGTCGVSSGILRELDKT